VNQFLKDHNGQWWVVTGNGLYTMRNDSMVKDHYRSSSKNPSLHIPYDNINQIYEDKQGYFWMATNGGGLVKWDKARNYKQYTTADGLCSNTLYAIMEGDKGYLWISTDNGLIQFDKQKGVVRIYTTDDGLKTNEFNRLSYYKRSDNKLFFGSVDGIISFYPAQIADPEVVQLPLQIIGATQYDNSTMKLYDATTNVLQTKMIDLNPQNNNLTLKLGVLDYEQKQHNFYYRIDGIHRNWIPVEAGSFTVADLPHGTYKLHIKARDHNGQLLKDEITITLNVIPPFYKSYKFFIVLLLFIAIIVAIAFYIVISIKKHRENLLLKVVDERTKELQEALAQQEALVNEIHHRVKNNLQVISGLLQLQSLKLEDEDAKEALRESQNRVVSIAMIHQKLYQHTNSDKVEFRSFVQELFEHVSAPYETGKKTKLQLELPELFFYTDTAIPMGLIMNELFTNSLKYAAHTVDEPVITIAYHQNEHSFNIIYYDNGNITQKQVAGDIQGGFGINMVKKLVLQIGANLVKDYSKGMKYTITLSMHHKQ